MTGLAGFGSLARAWLQAGAGTAYMLTAGVASREWRGRLVRVAREFGYHHRPGPAPTLLRVGAAAVADEGTPIVVREAVSTDGNVALYELLLLARAVATRSPVRLFEIGTFDGRTTLNVTANAPAHAQIFTLDLPPHSTSTVLDLDADDVRFARASTAGTIARRYHGTTEARKIVELFGDSATFDFSQYRASMDFVFVDGSHAYEYVLRDSHTALELTAPGGIIFWHDYGAWPGVTRALNELAERDTHFRALRHIEHTSLAFLQP